MKNTTMRTIVVFAFTICSLSAIAQIDSLNALEEIAAFQQKLNDEYNNRDTSPLDPRDFKKFKRHTFFPVDLEYRAHAKLTRTEGTPYFAMKTTTSRVSTERIFGYVEFVLAGKAFKLPVYQSRDLIKNPEYADYLFFPFTDLTNGDQTYMGGRYIDLRIPAEGDNLVIDFNQAYNPYCAYSHRYSCPIVPAENQMDIEVRAGVKHKKK